MRKLVAALTLLPAMFLTGCAQNSGSPLVLPPMRDVNTTGGEVGLACVGTGSPTVVLSTGLGGTSEDTWGSIDEEVAKTTRVCVTDRAGVGEGGGRNSGTNSPEQNAQELRDALVAAGEKGPYIYSGWSYGGLVSQVAAQLDNTDGDNIFPSGMVLIDSTIPDEYRTIDTQGWEEAGEKLNMEDGESLADAVRLARQPVVVLTAEQDGFTGEDEAHKLAQTAELVNISSNNLWASVNGSGHNIAQDDPQVVIIALNAAVQSARTDTPLPSCEKVFAGQNVTCKT